MARSVIAGILTHTGTKQVFHKGLTFYIYVLLRETAFPFFRSRKRLVMEEITSKMRVEKSKLDELVDQLDETTQ